jgi:hypothetical protein
MRQVKQVICTQWPPISHVFILHHHACMIISQYVELRSLHITTLQTFYQQREVKKSSWSEFFLYYKVFVILLHASCIWYVLTLFVKCHFTMLYWTYARRADLYSYGSSMGMWVRIGPWYWMHKKPIKIKVPCHKRVWHDKAKAVGLMLHPFTIKLL